MKITAVYTGLETMLIFYFEDGRHVSVPYTAAPTIMAASPEDRAKFSIAEDGSYVKWTEMKVKVSSKDLFAPVPDGKRIMLER